MINNPILMDSGVYVWEKYDVINLYKAQEATSGATSEPSDLVGSMYEGYTFDTATGEFTLTGDVTNVVPGYYASTSKNKIYKYKVSTITIPGTSVTAPTVSTIRQWNAINAIKESSKKSSTCYGTVTAEDEAAYPADGEQDGYWYVLVGKTGAEGGGDSPVLQVKSVTPSESSQNVTPDAGYDGLSKVTVGAIQTETKTVTSNGTVTPSAGKYLKQVTVNVPTSSSPNLQTKSVSPSESEQSVTPDTGYDGLSRVTVGAIQTETKTVTTNGTVTPSSGKYLKQVTVNVPTSGIDTSDATATADDIAKNKTAYINGEKVTGSLILVNDFNLNSNASWDSQNSKLMLSATPPKKCIFLANGSIKLFCTGENLGDATASDVAKGKTFTSSAGLRVTGTAKASAPTLQAKTVTPSAAEQTVTPDDSYDGLSSVTVEAMPTAALSTPTISVDSAGKITAKVEQTASGYVEAGSKSATKQLTTKGAATITPGTSDQTIASGTYLTGAQTIKGDANLVAGNIKSGVSIFGVAGSFEGSGGSGGSGDNNCEAYHITSASAKLNFKTTGTVKVWGYGSKRSSYTTTVYAFVGDGYYAGSSYGTPSKTSASFSINADGTLNGLPSGLQAVDLLVTIGV